MAQQDVDLIGYDGPERGAQGRNPGAGIDDDEPVSTTDLDAGRMAAELAELRAGYRRRTPRSPEPNLEPLRGCSAPCHRTHSSIAPAAHACALAHMDAW